MYGIMRFFGGESMSKRFLMITNTSKSASVEFSLKLKKYIVDKSCGVTEYSDDICSFDGFDFAIVLGGDGTVIDASAVLFDYEIPIACVNFGTLGYLSSCEPNEAFSLIDRLITGDYKIENRATLEGYIERNGEKLSSFKSINDVSIHRGVVNSSLDYELNINGELIDVFKSDGVLVSTPTGSTAYNLSAGGPVVAPGSNCLVVTQICAHSLNDCPIVISNEDSVCINILNDFSSPVLVSDHDAPVELKNKDLIFIRKGEKNIKTVKINDSSFYSVLRRKISHR